MAAIINHRNKIMYDIRSSSVLGGLKISMLLPEVKYIRFLLILHFLGLIGVP